MDERPNGTYWTRKRAMVEHALASMSGTAAKVMHVLEQKADASNGQILQIGAGELADMIGSDRRNVRDALAELEAAGCITQELPGPYGGRGRKRDITLQLVAGVALAPLFDGAGGPCSVPVKGGLEPPFAAQESGVLDPAQRGTGPPFSAERGVNHPHKVGSMAPSYIPPSPSSPPPGPPEAPAGAGRGERAGEEEAYRKRVKLLVQRGIFPDQARRFAKVFDDRQLREHWHDINSNPRIRKKGGAYASRLKQFLPE